MLIAPVVCSWWGGAFPLGVDLRRCLRVAVAWYYLVFVNKIFCSKSSFDFVLLMYCGCLCSGLGPVTVRWCQIVYWCKVG